MYTPEETKQHLREAADLAALPLEDVVLADEGRIAGNGLQLNYLDWGTAGLPPVLFLHGRSLTAHTWDLVCLALRTQYHCRALDLRGHGNSEWSSSGDYSLDAHRSDLESVVDELGLDHFILVGMSLGGATSLTYAGRNAHRLAALVLVDTGPETRVLGGQRLNDFVTGPREHDSIEDFVERAMAFNPLRRSDLLRRSLRHNLRQTPSGKWAWKYDHRINGPQTDEARERRRTMLWDAVPRVSCPTLVVRGSNSDIFHDEDAEKLAAALPRGSWIRIEGAGHTVQGDQPKALVEELRQWFSQVTQ